MNQLHRLAKEPNAVIVKFELPRSVTSVPPSYAVSHDFVRFQASTEDGRDPNI